MQPNNLLMLEADAFSADDGRRTHRVTCPACGGGGTKEVSLVLRKEHPLFVFGKCYRASCGAQFKIAKDSSIVGRRADTMASIQDTHAPETTAIPFDVADTIWRSYKLSIGAMEEAGYQYIPEHGSLYIPIHVGRSAQIGYLERRLSLSYATQPKSTLHLDSRQEDAEGLYLGLRTQSIKDSRCIILVEDALSALRLSSYKWLRENSIEARWLGGVSLSRMAETRLILDDPRMVIISLDSDAMRRAIQIDRQLSRYLPNVRILPRPESNRDIKDLSTDEFCSVVSCILNYSDSLV